jgi:hypothetical protein
MARSLQKYLRQEATGFAGGTTWRRRRRKEYGTMVQATMVTGICSTCSNLATCYQFARRGPVFFCELFEGCRPPNPAPSVPTERRRRSPAAEVVDPVEEIPHLMGLGVKGDLRDTCWHPKSPEGVWNCEEHE